MAAPDFTGVRAAALGAPVVVATASGVVLRPMLATTPAEAAVGATSMEVAKAKSAHGAPVATLLLRTGRLVA
jgi:hypothetical protein